MTRINVIPVSELSDQHLIAEYHELPRVLKQNINTTDAPDKYCLGKGHVKWARKHAKFCWKRFVDLIIEMEYRGFNTNFDTTDLLDISADWAKDYHPTPEDKELNRQRIREKYQMKPNWYHWTNRTKPEWINSRKGEIKNDPIINMDIDSPVIKIWRQKLAQIDMEKQAKIDRAIVEALTKPIKKRIKK